MFIKAARSLIKLLEAPLDSKLNTFTATIAPSDAITPLYTDPKLPAPIKLDEENLTVAWKSSLYVTRRNENSLEDSEEGLFFVILKQQKSRQAIIKKNPRKPQGIAIISICSVEDVCPFELLGMHLDKFN
jgi:hypothetical protein